jgi:hypothetical protein
VISFISKPLPRQIQYEASKVLNVYTRHNPLDPLVVIKICDLLKLSFIESRTKAELLSCLVNILQKKVPDFDDFQKLLTVEIMYALDYLVCEVLLPYDREIVYLISNVICFLLSNYGELFTSGNFLYSILLKFIYLSDEEIILNSLTYLDSVSILLNEGGCC